MRGVNRSAKNKLHAAKRSGAKFVGVNKEASGSSVVQPAQVGAQIAQAEKAAAGASTAVVAAKSAAAKTHKASKGSKGMTKAQKKAAAKRARKAKAAAKKAAKTAKKSGGSKKPHRGSSRRGVKHKGGMRRLRVIGKMKHMAKGKSFVVKYKKKKYLVKRTNPIGGFMGKIEDLVGMQLGEMGGLIAGGALTLSIDSLLGTAIIPQFLGREVLIAAAAGIAGKKFFGSKSKFAAQVSEGMIAAALVNLGQDLANVALPAVGVAVSGLGRMVTGPRSSNHMGSLVSGGNPDFGRYRDDYFASGTDFGRMVQSRGNGNPDFGRRHAMRGPDCALDQDVTGGQYQPNSQDAVAYEASSQDYADQNTANAAASSLEPSDGSSSDSSTS